MRIFFISFWCIVFSAIAQVHASDNPPLTNWGGVFKETHPLGPDDENNLASLSITRSLPQSGYVYYVIVEIYPTPEGLKNHQKIYRETSWKSEY